MNMTEQCGFALLLILSTAVSLDAVDKGEPISIHVTEVHRDQEGTEKGTWYHTRAVGETKTVVYTLKCDEFLSVEKRDYTLRCTPLSAGNDYSARKFDAAISFWKPEEKSQDYSLVAYEIVSEKEK